MACHDAEQGSKEPLALEIVEDIDNAKQTQDMLGASPVGRQTPLWRRALCGASSSGRTGNGAGRLAWLRPRHPRPLGPHAVGCFRARLPADPRSTAKQGLFAQVHYPVEPGAPRLSGVADARYIRDEVVERLASSQGFPRWLAVGLLGAQPTVDAPLVPKSAPSGGGWPVLLFSSGLWGTCEMYTQLCRDIASEGIIVLALEHEDASGMYAVCRETGKAVEYHRPPEGAEVVEFRRPFLEQRSRELNETVAAVAAASRGELAGQEPLAKVLRTADPDQLLLAGHSFGAAGVIFHLQQRERRGEPPGCLGALLLDTWTEPLADANQTWKLQVPFTTLLSQDFQGRKIVSEQVKLMVGANPERCLSSTFVRGTLHQWVSDSHLFLPAPLLRRLKVMGAGNYPRTRQASVRAANLSARALLDPAQADKLNDRILAVDAQVLAAFP